jgi:hypothetical protein
VKALFVGGPMDGRTQELPLNGDGLPPAEIPCEVYDGVPLHRLTPEHLEHEVAVKELIYVRTVNPLNEGPLVLYLAADPADWDSHPDDG